MANRKKVTLEAEFKHNFTVEADGRILYDCPMEIKGQADFDNYGITWDDCRTLNFHGSEKVTVYFMKVESRALAEYQWSYLDSKYSHRFASARCMFPGNRKPWAKCPDAVSCAKCPHEADCRPPVISLDNLISTGYEPVEGFAPDEQATAKLEYPYTLSATDQADYNRRLQAISDKNNNAIQKLEEELAAAEKELQQIKCASFASVITRENIDEIFSLTVTNEIGIENDFREIKGSEHFALVKYLIRNGYIDETYADYMTYFYENILMRTENFLLLSL